MNYLSFNQKRSRIWQLPIYITLIYVCGISNGGQAALVGHWKLDEGSGDVFRDSAAGNDGRLFDEPIAWVTDAPPGHSVAVSFSGENTGILTDFEGIGDDDPRTVTFWMKTDVPDNEPSHRIVAWGATADTEKWHIRVNNNAGNGELGAIRTEVQGGQNVATTVVNDDEWHHIAVVFPDGGEWNSDVMHFVDGEFDEQSGGGDQEVFTRIGDDAEPVSIGMGFQGDNPTFFPGLLADVRIYDEALSADAIRAIMSAGGGANIAGDLNGNGELDADDIERLSLAIRSGNTDVKYDLDANSVVDQNDRSHWISQLRQTWVGDSNLDGEFSSTDFVQIFTAGKFEQGVPATWEEGDWDGDGVFDSSDFVVAFTDGGFEQGPRNAAAHVPEADGFSLFVILFAYCFLEKRSSQFSR